MTTELHLWVMPVLGRSPRRALEGALKAFERAQGLSVRLWVVPWGTAWDRLMSALKGRHGTPAPDVLQIDSLWTGTLAHLGLLKELTPRLWELERRAVLPSLWAGGFLPSTRRLFSVPWMLDLRVPHVKASAAAGDRWEDLEALSARG